MSLLNEAINCPCLDHTLLSLAAIHCHRSHNTEIHISQYSLTDDKNEYQSFSLPSTEGRQIVVAEIAGGVGKWIRSHLQHSQEAPLSNYFLTGAPVRVSELAVTAYRTRVEMPGQQDLPF